MTKPDVKAAFADLTSVTSQKQTREAKTMIHGASDEYVKPLNGRIPLTDDNGDAQEQRDGEDGKCPACGQSLQDDVCQNTECG